MNEAGPIATDIMLAFPPGMPSAATDRIEAEEATDEQPVRIIIAFGCRIAGMPISTDVRFEQRVGAMPIILLEASKFASKHHARLVGCFVRKMCLIDGIQWGCLSNGSLILEVAYGADTGATIKCAYETLQEHSRIFASDPGPVAERAVVAH